MVFDKDKDSYLLVYNLVLCTWKTYICIVYIYDHVRE
jgi:hypothetical protein